MPGGDRVAFSAVTDSGRAICVRAADGTGETRVLTAGAVSPDISSDGRYLACQKMKGVVGDILVIDLTGQAEARTLVSGGTGFYRPLFSPDDRYLAYLSWETGSASTFIRPVTGGTGKWEIPETGESSLVWREDEILYTTYLSNRRVYRIPVKTRPTLSLGTREHLFDLDPLGIIPYDSFSVSPDGRTFLMVRELETDEIRGGMVVVENWIREFR
jgi:Tol biopolymer transport system component